MPKAASKPRTSKSKTRASSSGGAKGATAPAKKGGGKKRSKAFAFPDYKTALKWVYDRVDIERTRLSRVDPKVFKLDRMRKIMEHLGNPEQSLRCVHVAGTNGKGSICAMLTACLRECGYTVGTYTSPHLIDIRERITINDHMVSYAQFMDSLARVAEAVDALPPRLGPATFFEVVTAAAFVHFAEQAVDVAVIEVGLGGKLDSTNIITPDVALVGAIGKDHTQLLGATTELIAEQKAGIFKPGVPALTIQQEAPVIAAMRRVAESVGAQFEVVGGDVEFSCRFEANPPLGPHMRVGLTTPRVTFEHVPVPLQGEHQAQNCGLVLAAIDKLAERGFEAPEHKVIAGLEKTRLPGRMELAWRQPKVLLDGAHNAQAVTALVKSVGAHVQYDSMIVIFGCAADKDMDAMLSAVSMGADKVIFTRTKHNPRAALPQELARRFTEVSGKMCQSAETLEDALAIAVRAAGREDLICITGSFYLVGEAKRLLAEKAAKAGVEV